jgi:hypothetical protein
MIFEYLVEDYRRKEKVHDTAKQLFKYIDNGKSLVGKLRDALKRSGEWEKNYNE